MKEDGTLSLTGKGDGKGSPAAASLILVLATENPLSPSRSFDLADVEEVVMGRGEEEVTRKAKKLGLGFRDRWMSSQHARLVREGDAWWVEDCSSKNGVFLNGEAIDRDKLEDGDVLELGHTFFVMRRGPEDLPASPKAKQVLSSYNPSFIRTLALLERMARSALPVLLHGETGTGKELMARALHDLSARSGPFLAVNCGALPAGLIESELFGFRRGAFSGAVEDRPGLVRAAHGGTLFLDEIGELAPAGQTALLRVLQEREVHPVGATKPVPVDIRVLAATHRDLALAAERAEFRADLLARLSGFTVRLPPLRERREDLGLLIRALVARLAPERKQLVFTHEAARALFRRSWSKNVRELERCLGAALVLAQDDPIAVHHLFGASDASSERRKPGWRATSRSLDENEQMRRDQLEALLIEHRGNVTAVAKAMKRAREVVHRWIKRYGLDSNEYRR